MPIIIICDESCNQPLPTGVAWVLGVIAVVTVAVIVWAFLTQ